MTKKEILEGNKLIAFFMGFTDSDVNPIILSVPKGEELKYKAFRLNINKMNYNSSWDWLIPVLNKINKIKIGIAEAYYDRDHNLTKLSRKFHSDCSQLDNMLDLESSCLLPANIEVIYPMVITFVKWYNQKNLANKVFKKRTYRSRRRCKFYLSGTMSRKNCIEPVRRIPGGLVYPKCIGVNCGYYKDKTK